MSTTSSLSNFSQQGKDPPPPLTSEEADILRSVQEQLIKMLADKKIDTNVYNDGSGNGVAAVMKENEQNVKNRAREVAFTARIER
jgi:kinetochore protein Mis13/DSN1